MLNPILLIEIVGLIGIIFIIFAETGLFFGFFLPGDSLLFTAGILASQGIFDIYQIIIFCIIAAILGDSVGYWSGKKYGRKLFERDVGFFFKKKRIHDAEKFYEKHGKYTIIIARFVPIIRTFAPIVAGIGSMHYRTFIAYNIVGGVFWVTGLTMVGYLLGSVISSPDRYIIPMVFVIIFVSVLPVVLQIVREKFKKSK